jgi:AcrR family transcriptional regulator
VYTAAYTVRGIPVEHVETPPGRQLLPRAERRAAILRGAAEAFARTGFADTSMDDVAAACGVTRLIVYRHFGTKEDLYRAILQAVVDRLGEELKARLARPGNAGVGATTLLTVAREDPAAFRLLWRQAAREPQFADYVTDLRQLAGDVVRSLAGLHDDDKVLDRWMGEAIIGWLVESVLTWLEVGDPARDAEMVARTTAGLRAVRDAWA